MNVVNSEVYSVSPFASCLATIQQQTKGLAEGFPRPQLPTFPCGFLHTLFNSEMKSFSLCT